MSDVVRAAGGLVTRRNDDGTPEVILVHRPRYHDWTFPKGKALPGESDEECALREVEEETGLRCELEDELPSTSYRDVRGRKKTVRYWTMRPIGGQLEAPPSEVDEVAWFPLERASQRLSYDRDRRVLEELERVVV